MDIQVSYVRLLIGDNSRSAPVYSDAQIRSAITLGPVRPALPAKLQLAGTVAAVRYPGDASSGPF
jgi:hypothetical protein